MEKGAVVIPGDLLLLDYDDYEDDVKIEKSTPKYLAFVKSKKDSVHYIVSEENHERKDKRIGCAGN